MTVIDPCATSHWQTRPGDGAETVRMTVPPPAAGHARQLSGPQWSDPSYDEPPAGLGPWIPPLPRAEPLLSPQALTWFGIAAVTLLIAAATAVVVVISGAAAPVRTATDGLYLDSVRHNSALSSADISDTTLIETGHTVCSSLDARPSTSSVLGAMRDLGVANGWGDDDVAAVVGSAIGAYCPRHIALVNA